MTERLRTLALMAQSDPARANLYSAEVSGLRDQMLANANTSFQGQYLFGVRFVGHVRTRGELSTTGAGNRKSAVENGPGFAKHLRMRGSL